MNCRSSCSQKEILQYSQENTCIGVPFQEIVGLEPSKSIKRRRQHRCFPVNIAKFLRTAFPIEQLWWLLLELRHNFKTYENSMTQT